MSRLRWKLLAATLVLVAVTVGLSALLTRRVTHDQVRRLLVARQRIDVAPLAARLGAFYRTAGGWEGVGSEVDRIAAESGNGVVLTDPEREPIAVSAPLGSMRIHVTADDRVTIAGSRGGAEVRMLVVVPPLPVRDAAGRPVGLLYLLPAEEPQRLEEGEPREMAALDRHLLATFAAAAAIGVLLTFLIARRITGPVERLTAAADEMARGALDARVEVSGSDEIARLARSFNAMADSLAAQRELRRRMVGDVAHELRTPLTSLRCELESIQDGLAAPDPARLASLHEEVLHLGRVVDDLQELAVADSGRLALDRRRFNLGVAVARRVEIFGPEAARRGVALEVEAVRGEAAVEVEADPMRIDQIVRNLVGNALRHTPEGGRVVVGVRAGEGEAMLSVADSGPGIPAGELDRVFERFYRVDESRARESGGAGLGLAIVRRLVELHGGRVWAESEEGRGATFFVVLPRAASSPLHNPRLPSGA